MRLFEREADSAVICSVCGPVSSESWPSSSQIVLNHSAREFDVDVLDL